MNSFSFNAGSSVPPLALRQEGISLAAGERSERLAPNRLPKDLVPEQVSPLEVRALKPKRHVTGLRHGMTWRPVMSSLRDFIKTYQTDADLAESFVVFHPYRMDMSYVGCPEHSRTKAAKRY